MVGSDSVVIPSYIGGLTIASEMIRPSVVSFLDIMLRSKDSTIRVEEIEIPEGSLVIWKILLQTTILGTEGVTVVILKDRKKDTYIFNPSTQTVLTADHTVIVIGSIDIIKQMEKNRSKRTRNKKGQRSCPFLLS